MGTWVFLGLLGVVGGQSLFPENSTNSPFPSVPLHFPTGEDLVESLVALVKQDIPMVEGMEDDSIDADALFNQCWLDVLYLGVTLKNVPKAKTDLLHNWAVKVVDAFGKPKTGLTKGNLLWPGDFGLCQEVNSGPGNFTISVKPFKHLPALHLHFSGHFVGQWVKVIIHLPQAPFIVLPGAPHFGSLQWGLCLPRSCNATELDDLIARFFRSSALVKDSGVEYEGLEGVGRAPPLNARARVAAALIGSLFGLVLIATLTDCVLRRRARRGREWDQLKEEDSESVSSAEVERLESDSLGIDSDSDVSGAAIALGWARRVVLAFSFYGHVGRVCGEREAGRDLRAVEGLRVLTSAWLVLGHAYYFALPVSSNPLEISDPNHHGFFFQIVLQSIYVVDTFYLLSGTLLAYNFLRRVRQDPGCLTQVTFWLAFYAHRFIRILVPYAVIMVTYAGLNEYFGSGPLWPQQGLEVESDQCRSTLWTNLVFVNNLFPIYFNASDGNLHREYCGVWTWYLANEMQYFIISPLFLIPLAKGLGSDGEGSWMRRRSWTSWGAGLVALVSIACVIGSGVVAYANEWPPNPFPADIHKTDVIEAMTNAGYGPGSHAVCFLVGIILGWSLLHGSPAFRTKLHRVVLIIGWTLSVSICMAVIFGIWPQYRGHPFSNRVASFYSAASRLGWSIGVGWVVYACARHGGGLVGRVLESSYWLCFSRLSYVFYLIHPIIIMTFYFSRPESVYVDDYAMTVNFGGFLVVGYLAAFFVSAVVESPVLALGKLFFPSLHQTRVPNHH